MWSSLVSQGVALLDQLLQARRAGSNQLADLFPSLNTTKVGMALMPTSCR